MAGIEVVKDWISTVEHIFINFEVLYFNHVRARLRLQRDPLPRLINKQPLASSPLMYHLFRNGQIALESEERLEEANEGGTQIQRLYRPSRRT